MGKRRRRKQKIQKESLYFLIGTIVITSIILILVIFYQLQKENQNDNFNIESNESNIANKEQTQTSSDFVENTTVTESEIIQSSTQDIINTESETEVDVIPEVSSSEPTYINGILIVNKTYPLPADYDPGALDATVLSSFNTMRDDAKQLGLNLYISSGYRSYEDQKRIYKNYVAVDGQINADKYSARPGYSEHQTGLAFDLNTINDAFADTDEGKWVAENAHHYGFIIRYPKGKEDITGYKYEPWHLRYVGIELATELYNSNLCLEEYLNITSVYKSN